jgi:hypothetical protein
VSVGYGREVWCTDAIVTGRYVTGWLVVAQALYRRLITPRGTLRWGDEESCYGLDVSGFVGAMGEDASVLALPALVAAELSKDDRVADVRCSALTSEANGLISIVLTVDVVLASEDSDFRLTLSITDARVVLLSASEVSS